MILPLVDTRWRHTERYPGVIAWCIIYRVLTIFIALCIFAFCISSGLVPLHVATTKSHLDVIEILLKHEAKVSAKKNN